MSRDTVMDNPFPDCHRRLPLAQRNEPVAPRRFRQFQKAGTADVSDLYYLLRTASVIATDCLSSPVYLEPMQTEENFAAMQAQTEEVYPDKAEKQLVAVREELEQNPSECQVAIQQWREYYQYRMPAVLPYHRYESATD